MNKVTVDNAHHYNIEKVGEDILLNGNLIHLDMKNVSKNHFHILLENKSYSAEVVKVDHIAKEVIIKINGREYQVALKDENDNLLESLGIEINKVQSTSHLKAPMPGLVLEILVEPGSNIKKGDSLLVLEAMKMENLIKSPSDITIKSIEIKKGDKVEKNQILLYFEPII